MSWSEPTDPAVGGRVAVRRAHVDLVTADVDAAVARLRAAGARWLREEDERGWRFVVLADPWGHRWCVLPGDATPLAGVTPSSGAERGRHVVTCSPRATRGSVRSRPARTSSTVRRDREVMVIEVAAWLPSGLLSVHGAGAWIAFRHRVDRAAMDRDRARFVAVRHRGRRAVVHSVAQRSHPDWAPDLEDSRVMRRRITSAGSNAQPLTARHQQPVGCERARCSR